MLKFSQENMKYDCLVNIQGLKPASSANDLSVGRDKKLICFHNYLCQLRCKYWTPLRYQCGKTHMILPAGTQ